MSQKEIVITENNYSVDLAVTGYIIIVHNPECILTLTAYSSPADYDKFNVEICNVSGGDIKIIYEDTDESMVLKTDSSYRVLGNLEGGYDVLYTD